MRVIRRDECAECGAPMVADRILCPRNSEHIGRVTVEYVPRADADRGAVDLADEFEMLADACGHCLAAGRPPNEQMIASARAALAAFRGQ